MAEIIAAARPGHTARGLAVDRALLPRCERASAADRVEIAVITARHGRCSAGDEEIHVMKFLRTLGVLAVCAGCVWAPARSRAQETVIQQTSTVRTEQVQVQQQTQIQQGIARGAVEPRYAERLMRALARIQQAQERAYSDGVLTLREQRTLERAQTRLQRHIDRAIQGR
jgi:hypothetical protein